MVTEILKRKGINHSTFRIKVLEILINTNKPLTQKEIESHIGSKHDRVTMYRTLKLFVKENLVHKIPVSESLCAYRYVESEVKNESDHLHFHCTECEQVYCIQNVQIQDYSLPKGFIQEDTNLIVSGICKKCNKSIKIC